MRREAGGPLSDSLTRIALLRDCVQYASELVAPNLVFITPGERRGKQKQRKKKTRPDRNNQQESPETLHDSSRERFAVHDASPSSRQRYIEARLELRPNTCLAPTLGLAPSSSVRLLSPLFRLSARVTATTSSPGISASWLQHCQRRSRMDQN